MPETPVLHRLETVRLVLRRRQVEEAATYRQLWTERDPRVPAHRRIDATGRPTLDDIREQLRGASLSGLVVLARPGTGDRGGPRVVGWAGRAGLPRLWADVGDWNTASRRVLDELGFRETGVTTAGEHGVTLTTVLELDRPPRDGPSTRRHECSGLADGHS